MILALASLSQIAFQIARADPSCSQNGPVTCDDKHPVNTYVYDLPSNDYAIDLQSYENHYKDLFLHRSSIKRSAENDPNPTTKNDQFANYFQDVTNASEMDSDKYARDNETDLYNMTIQEENCIGDRDFCNLTHEEYYEMLLEYIFPQPYEWVLIVSHTLVFLIGLVGNALVCVAVYRNHSMRTVTNYFIVNLAVADFMVILFCLPPTVLWDVTETWFFGNAMCRIILYFQVRI